jgi:hypothetical protein
VRIQARLSHAKWHAMRRVGDDTGLPAGRYEENTVAVTECDRGTVGHCAARPLPNAEIRIRVSGSPGVAVSAPIIRLWVLARVRARGARSLVRRTFAGLAALPGGSWQGSVSPLAVQGRIGADAREAVAFAIAAVAG